MLILVYLHIHSLQVIKSCRTYSAKNLKESHELPLLSTAFEAQMMDTYQTYPVTELCKQHLEINEQGSTKMSLRNLFSLLVDNGINLVVLVQVNLVFEKMEIVKLNSDRLFFSSQHHI